ncbi:DUF952 domain-containing protein [Evansella sp. LMS18]|jgi:uncharacterized protein (DUF952 family)|uniref:DUF952 domain-containing protein n=1 Tax=Evansella sp. LMS18 TaxID=2924033 RepID=UPI0020D12C10|nr:DUF952 domain-containing protein [Evansella sp. LMS18]UTR09736.1 DUF952 domain-containing protein [Evansella sp. LMS18]
MIYHILTAEEWEAALKEEQYWPESVDVEGYIHCFTDKQLKTADGSSYPSGKELVLLKIDSAKLENLVIFEDLNESGTMYPHVYGYLNLDAVVSVTQIANDDTADLTKYIKEA